MTVPPRRPPRVLRGKRRAIDGPHDVEHDAHPEEEEDDLQRFGIPETAGAPLARSLTASASPKQHVLDVAHAGADAGREVAAAELGQDRVLDDELRQGVGHHRLEPAADLDPDLVLVGRDDEQDAVVLALLADAPRAAELVAEVLDRVALQRLERDDDDLIGRGVLDVLRAPRSSAA